jgi:hypothetical protein
MVENIKAKIKAYCEANNVSEDWNKIVLKNDLDDNGTSIFTWEMSISKPTDEQLNSYSVSQTDQEYDEAKIQVKENSKVSGNQKLLDLGLTQAEATALTGYTPPVAE